MDLNILTETLCLRYIYFKSTDSVYIFSLALFPWLDMKLVLTLRSHWFEELEEAEELVIDPVHSPIQPRLSVRQHGMQASVHWKGLHTIWAIFSTHMTIHTAFLTYVEKQPPGKEPESHWHPVNDAPW